MLHSSVNVRESPVLNRRRLLQFAAMSAGSGLLAACGGLQAQSTWRTPISPRRYSDHPFKLGIASGDPRSDGVVLWTRLAPDPFNRESLPPEVIAIDWELATDPKMEWVVQRGVGYARPEFGHAVHVEVRDLEPGRQYWYRFRTGGEVSEIGRTVTAPVLGAPLERLRFAFASCQHYEQGYFTAYKHMIEDEPDLILHLGDYIYESSWGEQMRQHEGPEPRTLDQYRNRHALYRTDKDLQAAHAACPWRVTWDDHEVQNDYGGDFSEDFEAQAEFRLRRLAAYQAYYEHMPLRALAAPSSENMQLYNRLPFGDLIEFTMLDNRQYRDEQVCREPKKGGGHVVYADSCPDLANDKRSMLGADQERWLLGGFSRSKAKWNVIAQSMLFSRLHQKNKEGKDGSWTDGWDGYAGNRKRIVDRMVETKLANPVVIGGDIHSFWVCDVKPDYDTAKSPVIASEIIGSSISSAGPPHEMFKAFLPDNPHIKFFDARQRGYVMCEVTQKSLKAHLRTVKDVRDPNTTASTLASYLIENGHPGAQKFVA